MIADGYKAFVNKSDVASVVKEYVAIIAVGISGAGNGKLCSQLNTAISFDEAMYLFEGMWLFLFFQRGDFHISPRRLRAKYTHRTKLRFVLCVFRDCIEPSAAACRRIWREPRNEEIALQFLNAPLQGAAAERRISS